MNKNRMFPLTIFITLQFAQFASGHNTVTGAQGYAQLSFVYILANVLFLGSLYYIDKKIPSVAAIISMKNVAIACFIFIFLNMVFVSYVYVEVT